MSRAPWERLDDESARAFQAFAIYRNLPPHERSISRVVSELAGRRTDGERTGNLAGLRRRVEGWSSRFRWQERIAAWDGHVDERVQQEQLAAAVASSERQVLEVRLALRAMSAASMALIDRLRERALREELGDVPADRLIALAATCARHVAQLQQAERDALGFRSEVVATAAMTKAVAAREAAAAGEPDDGDLVARFDRLAAVYGAMEEAGQPQPPLDWQPEDGPGG